jgi:hypothetical protein
MAFPLFTNRVMIIPIPDKYVKLLTFAIAWEVWVM